eukprot:CAMPEP_0113487098 /NCGR_PEP_ID=MMETSP0014_2-20120614/25335_1 /TAXON_ID=2857 /ORGANISM="Nitzschia sp." /LENGTH=674 /DNA_ID=CAMNT_0000380787 /DNA_START=82 /DNA_END=2106 /DNA_ORIENTATION=+ /assembly_acc=CAM_ASM_000159
MPLRIPAVAAAVVGVFVVVDETIHIRDDLLLGSEHDDHDDDGTANSSGSASKQQRGNRRRRSPTTNSTHSCNEHANGKNNKILRRSSSSFSTSSSAGAVVSTRSTTARSVIVGTAVTILISLGLFGHFSITSMFLSTSSSSSSSNSNSKSFGNAAVHDHHLRTKPNSQIQQPLQHTPPRPPLPLSQQPPKLRLHSDDIEIVRYVASGSINNVFECKIVSQKWWDYQYSLPTTESSQQQRQRQHQPQRFFDGNNRNHNHTRTTSTSTTKAYYSKFMLKVGVDHFYGPQEDEAMKRIYEEEQKAIELGFLPLVESWPNVTNPFLKNLDDDEEEEEGSSNDIKSSLRAIIQKLQQDDKDQDQDSIDMLQRLIDPKNDRIYAVIVPDASDDRLGYVYQHQLLDTLPKIKLFMKSILQQLQHAWKAGVNNMDLSGDRNVYVSKHNYQAILFDWNGWVRPGKVVHDPFWNQRLVPPEYWLETMNGQQVHMSPQILHGFDVWSVGYMLARLIYAPFCGWVDHLAYDNDSLKRLQDTILTLGINQYDPSQSGQLPQFWVPVGDGRNSRIDLTKMANLTKDDFDEVYEETRARGNNKDFEPMLQGTRSHFRYTACPEETKFDVLVDPAVSKTDAKNVVDLLKQMMTISPLERPNYDELLAHSFFTEESVIAGANADDGVSSNQ